MYHPTAAAGLQSIHPWETTLHFYTMLKFHRSVKYHIAWLRIEITHLGRLGPSQYCGTAAHLCLSHPEENESLQHWNLQLSPENGTYSHQYAHPRLTRIFSYPHINFTTAAHLRTVHPDLQACTEHQVRHPSWPPQRIELERSSTTFW